MREKYKVFLRDIEFLALAYYNGYRYIGNDAFNADTLSFYGEDIEVWRGDGCTIFSCPRDREFRLNKDGNLLADIFARMSKGELLAIESYIPSNFTLGKLPYLNFFELYEKFFS